MRLIYDVDKHEEQSHPPTSTVHTVFLCLTVTTLFIRKRSQLESTNYKRKMYSIILVFYYSEETLFWIFKKFMECRKQDRDGYKPTEFV